MAAVFNSKFTISNRPQVTHIVTELSSIELVKKCLDKDWNSIPDGACILSTAWLVDCLKNSRLIPVLESHKLIEPQVGPESSTKITSGCCLEWACQRGAKLNHLNKWFTEDLELLQSHAELRDENHDYSRALAFRRASCVLKTLPFVLTNLSQLDGLKDIGEHVRRVLADILDHGYCEEVEKIRHSSWFCKMKLFTSVFGIGPATAKSWIEKGFQTIEDVRHAGCVSKDWRVSWGLDFHEDLTSPVLKQEAETFLSVVTKAAEEILPGVIVTLTGGFRRGKSSGHDVDILLSHPTEGAESTLLPRLLEMLERKGFILCGQKVSNTFRAEYLNEEKKSYLRGQLDHFEKWFGICKFPKSFQQSCTKDDQGALQNQEIKYEPKFDGKKQAPDLINAGKSFKSNTEQLESTTYSLLNDESSKEGDNSREVTGKFNLKTAGEKEGEEVVCKKMKFSDHAVDASTLASVNRDWLARRVDLIVAPYSQYFYALVGWTGSKHFNRDARLYAQKVLGLKLTSHGLFDFKKQMVLAAASEEEVFSHLNLQIKDPTDRNC